MLLKNIVSIQYVHLWHFKLEFCEKMNYTLHKNYVFAYAYSNVTYGERKKHRLHILFQYQFQMCILQKWRAAHFIRIRFLFSMCSEMLSQEKFLWKRRAVDFTWFMVSLQCVRLCWFKDILFEKEEPHKS